MKTEFRLYRAGPVVNAPWSDAQLWAIGTGPEPPAAGWTYILHPVYGSAAAFYQLDLVPEESPEPGWLSCRSRLCVDYCTTAGGGYLPLAWYTGAPTDWPSGLARFPEVYGPAVHTMPYGSPAEPRAVWTVAARRID